jgi:carbon storage regulator
MLVLSRKSNESVVIGGSGGFERVLVVTVLEVSGGKVRLGFEVDEEVPVHRSEVWERLRNGDQAGTASKEVPRDPAARPHQEPQNGQAAKIASARTESDNEVEAIVLSTEKGEQ